MKRAAVLLILLVGIAGYVFVQTRAPARDLAQWMPGGALLYLETPDFGRLLREWDASSVKRQWLGSANYDVFSQSNLFVKLARVYQEYGNAVGFLPGLPEAVGTAGTESALALYGIRDVEFLYVTRMGEAQLVKSRLWAVRDRFEQRQAGGVSFYLRRDATSGRTVAFAFTNGYLLLATRDDLVARALARISGDSEPSVASERWYGEATAAASGAGQLRLVMNLESVAKSDYFRSYWVQRNASSVRQYWAGIADLTRSASGITDKRAFLRSSEAAPVVPEVSKLLALVPTDAGLYRISSRPAIDALSATIVSKLIASVAQQPLDDRISPAPAVLDAHAGSEADLESRIDEPPLPPENGRSAAVGSVQAIFDNNRPEAMLELQSSAPAGGTFVRTPAVLVVAGNAGWDGNAVRAALSSSVSSLWTTSGLGAGWVTATVGRHSAERLDGLGTLLYAIDGNLLFVGNDPARLAAALERVGDAAPETAGLTYAAGFRHRLESGNYQRMMGALDFYGKDANASPFFGAGANGPGFFSANLASLSRVLSSVTEVAVTEKQEGLVTRQEVVYRMGRQ
ncbi:MAG: hypothetical protein JO323_04790 [Acidobacteriia bacterium]|nr:hypothetical protein [Terriglobia bacterium]